MGAEHVLQIATIAQLDFAMSKGHCIVEGCQATHDSEYMIVILGKCLAVGVKEAMKEVVELELLLMSTPGRPKFLTGTSMFHNIFELCGELAFHPHPIASYAEDALLHVLFQLSFPQHMLCHIVKVPAAMRFLRKLQAKMPDSHCITVVILSL